MKYERSEALEKFLNDEIASFEGQEEKSVSNNSEDFKNAITAEIEELESRFDALSEDDKEYLEWLKADE